MMRIRPVHPDDLPRLVELARSAGTGLTTLPDNEDILAQRIVDSGHAFAKSVETPGGESYFMVLEEVATGRIAGTTAIYAGVGLQKTFYNYRINTLVQKSHEHDITVTTRILNLVNDYTGTTEVGTLFLHPDFRRDGNGRLLARCRYLLMACFKQRFSDVVLAEMRGWQDGDGNSPFWEAIGAHFFKQPFHMADYTSGIGDNQFIADLMPKFPIYIELLPKAAQKVIGKTHRDTAPALAMLQSEGFRHSNAVDIFDAGPCVDVRLDDIRTVRTSREVIIDKLVDGDDRFARFMACAPALDAYQAFYLPLHESGDGTIMVDRAAAQSLGLSIGGALRIVEA